uniref:Uncharacterized protein n=1 Tax=Kalanchoe fedtschenkoi TaxID=63787 RepID=A0A7N0UWK7_KALFE
MKRRRFTLPFPKLPSLSYLSAPTPIPQFLILLSLPPTPSPQLLFLFSLPPRPTPISQFLIPSLSSLTSTITTATIPSPVTRTLAAARPQPHLRSRTTAPSQPSTGDGSLHPASRSLSQPPAHSRSPTSSSGPQSVRSRPPEPLSSGPKPDLDVRLILRQSGYGDLADLFVFGDSGPNRSGPEPNRNISIRSGPDQFGTGSGSGL